MMAAAAPMSGPSTKASKRHARMFGSYQQLTPVAYKVLGALRSYVFDGERRLIDYGWLVNETGLSVSTVSRAMQEIEEAGFILRQRESPGRGHIYLVQMLPPPEQRVGQPELSTQKPEPAPEASPHQEAPFLSPETLQERSRNVSPVKRSEDEVSPPETPQNGVFHSPPNISENQQQKKENGDHAFTTISVENPAPASASPAIVPPPHLAPHQQALFIALQHYNANIVALELVERRPDLTVADLEADMAAAQARENVELPIGLVYEVWMSGSRVTPPRSLAGQGSGGRGQEAAPSHQATPLTATQQYLLDQNFSAKVAEEFKDFDLAAVQEGIRDTIRYYDTEDERNLKIGRLVKRWRVCPPKPLPRLTTAASEVEEEEVMGDAEVQQDDEITCIHQGMTAAGYPCDWSGIYVCAPATQADLDALWREQHGDAPQPTVPTPEPAGADTSAPAGADTSAPAGADTSAPACEDTSEPAGAAQSAPEQAEAGETVSAASPASPVPTDAVLGRVWQQVLEQMREWLAFDEVVMLERETSLMGISANHHMAFVGCPNAARRDDIKYHYLAVIRRALTAVLGGTVQVCFAIQRC